MSDRRSGGDLGNDVWMAPNPDAVDVVDLLPGDGRLDDVLRLAASVLAQDRYLVSPAPLAVESHVFGAFHGGAAVGFLRLLVQVIGVTEGRPPVVHAGAALTEGYVEAFGVDPAMRRRGIGSALQRHAAEHARAVGCYQIRSRSPITSVENYALKIDAGYLMSPSEENDSYYFVLRL